jgi:SecY interacting protein Syd
MSLLINKRFNCTKQTVASIFQHAKLLLLTSPSFKSRFSDMPVNNNPCSHLSIDQALDQFFERWYQEKRDNDPKALQMDYDSEWPSNCFVPSDNKEQGALYQWQPQRQAAQDMFERLSDALEIPIHPDLIAYYTRYWSYHLSARSEEGELELLQVWNQEDMERLRSNLLGHALDQKKRKLPLSFFFAITFPDEGMLCINNNNGEIWYEMPGKKPLRKIAENLSEFLQRLSP